MMTRHSARQHQAVLSVPTAFLHSLADRARAVKQPRAGQHRANEG
jgi:hypothetical protein